MWFTGEKEKACVADFLNSLQAINADITERNKKLDVPYIYISCLNVVLIASLFSGHHNSAHC